MLFRIFGSNGYIITFTLFVFQMLNPTFLQICKQAYTGHCSVSMWVYRHKANSYVAKDVGFRYGRCDAETNYLLLSIYHLLGGFKWCQLVTPAALAYCQYATK